MKLFNVILFLLFFVRLGNATETISNGNINVGTETTGTVTIPIKLYPMELIIEPREKTIKAGEELGLATSAKIRWNTGSITNAIKITYDLLSTKTGSYDIKVNGDGLSTTIKVNIVPNDAVDLIIIIKPIEYGKRCKISDYFKVVGIDQYGNQATGLSYSWTAQLQTMPSKITQRMDGGLTLPNRTFVSAFTFQSGIAVLPSAEFIVYDLGTMIGTITLTNGVNKTFSFIPTLNFPSHYLNFQLMDIDIQSCQISIDYYLGQTVINRQISFPQDWLIKFMKLDLINVIEVLCYINIEILKQAEIIYQNEYKKSILNMLKPCFQKD